MSRHNKPMPTEKDPAKWLDGCPECLARDNPPHIVEMGSAQGPLRCHYECRDCHGEWITEYRDQAPAE